MRIAVYAFDRLYVRPDWKRRNCECRIRGGRISVNVERIRRFTKLLRRCASQTEEAYKQGARQDRSSSSPSTLSVQELTNQLGQSRIHPSSPTTRYYSGIRCDSQSPSRSASGLTVVIDAAESRQKNLDQLRWKNGTDLKLLFVTKVHPRIL